MFSVHMISSRLDLNLHNVNNACLCHTCISGHLGMEANLPKDVTRAKLHLAPTNTPKIQPSKLDKPHAQFQNATYKGWSHMLIWGAHLALSSKGWNHKPYQLTWREASSMALTQGSLWPNGVTGIVSNHWPWLVLVAWGWHGTRISKQKWRNTEESLTRLTRFKECPSLTD